MFWSIALVIVATSEALPLRRRGFAYLCRLEIRSGHLGYKIVPVESLSGLVIEIDAPLSPCTSLLEVPQLQFEQPLRDVLVQYGDSLTLFCSIYAIPQAAITWLHRGQIVASYSAPVIETSLLSSRIASGIIETRLAIPCMSSQSLGEYTCQASSQCGDMISSTAVVSLSNSVGEKFCNTTVGKAPTITLSSASRLELAGTLVQLMCRADGIPKPKISWQRITDTDNLTPIDEESNMVLSTGDLLVVADPQTITESYRCTARNPSGIATADSTVVFVSQ